MNVFNNNFHRQDDKSCSDEESLSCESTSTLDDRSSSTDASNEVMVQPRLFRWRKKVNDAESVQEDNVSALSYRSVSESVREFIDNVENTFDTVMDPYISDSETSDSDVDSDDESGSTENRTTFAERMKKAMSPSAIQKKMTQGLTPRYTKRQEHNVPSPTEVGKRGFFGHTPKCNEHQGQNSPSPIEAGRRSFFDMSVDNNQPSLGFYNWPMSTKDEKNSKEEIVEQEPTSTKSLPSRGFSFKFGKGRKEQKHMIEKSVDTKKEESSASQYPSSNIGFPYLSAFNLSTIAKSTEATSNTNLTEDQKENVERKDKRSKKCPSSTKALKTKPTSFNFGFNKKGLEMKAIDTRVKKPTIQSKTRLVSPSATKSTDKRFRQLKDMQKRPLSSRATTRYASSPKALSKRPSSTKSFKSKSNSLNYGSSEGAAKRSSKPFEKSTFGFGVKSTNVVDERLTPTSLNSKERRKSRASSNRFVSKMKTNKNVEQFNSDFDSLATPPENKNAFWNELVSYVHEVKIPEEITIENASLKKNRFPSFPTRTTKGRGKNRYESLS